MDNLFIPQIIFLVNMRKLVRFPFTVIVYTFKNLHCDLRRLFSPNRFYTFRITSYKPFKIVGSRVVELSAPQASLARLPPIVRLLTYSKDMNSKFPRLRPL